MVGCHGERAKRGNLIFSEKDCLALLGLALAYDKMTLE
jgi:hypothetical protein